MAAEDFTVPAAAVLIVGIVFGGITYMVSQDSREAAETAKQCISHGMVWHDQTNDCTKG